MYASAMAALSAFLKKRQCAQRIDNQNCSLLEVQLIVQRDTQPGISDNVLGLCPVRVCRGCAGDTPSEEDASPQAPASLDHCFRALPSGH